MLIFHLTVNLNVFSDSTSLKLPRKLQDLRRTFSTRGKKSLTLHLLIALISQSILVLFVLSAPTAPAFLNHAEIAPSEQHGPRVRLNWSRPDFENGKIRNYTLFYSHSEDKQSVHTNSFGQDTFSYVVGVLGGVNYQFSIRAVTIKPGTNASISVNTREYGKN